MNLRFIVVLWLLTGLFCDRAVAQGKLVFLNGKEKRFSTAEVKGEYIVYQPEGSSKTWPRKADKYNVFSILKDDGTEEIIYTPDTSDGGDPTIEEVRDYIKGEKHAVEVYRKPMNLIGGIAVGVAGSAAGFYGIPVPLVYTTVLGLFDPKLPRSERDLVNSEAYIAGYKRKAKNMKIKNSLIGGGIGFSVGLAAFIIILGND